MNYDRLRILSQKNEIRIDNHSGFTRTPPHYYDSLRHAFEAYCKTFHSQNASYHFYAEGLAERDVTIFGRQILDEENTVLAIIGFERFFELFFKDLLRRINPKLTYVSSSRLPKNNKAERLVSLIDSGSFIPRKFKNRNLSATFRETLDRYYGLIELVKAGNQSPLVAKFARQFKKYSYLDSKDHEGSMRLLSWYRDRILHNGNRLPSLWLLDYIVTQRFIPIIVDIRQSEKKKYGNALFYFATVTGIDILNKLNSISYEFTDLKDPHKKGFMFKLLLYIGHLKEMGRANLNMNFFVRNNSQATHEYNYKDPIGRGIRFAQAEKIGHPDFKKIEDCPCCGEQSMVIYRFSMNSPLEPSGKLVVEWLKCYTCEYHIRFNSAGDPNFFKLHGKPIFSL